MKFVKGLKELEPDSYLEYFLEKLNDHFELDEIKIYYSTFKMIFEEFGIYIIIINNIRRINRRIKCYKW